MSGVKASAPPHPDQQEPLLAAPPPYSSQPSRVYQPQQAVYYPPGQPQVIQGQPTILIVNASPQFDPELEKCRIAALVTSIFSIFTCLCCFWIPAIVLAVKKPGSRSAYKTAIILASVALVLSAIASIISTAMKAVNPPNGSKLY